MKALNEKERNNTFLKFTIMFCLAIIVYLLAAFAGTNIPFKENDVLRSKMKTYNAKVGDERKLFTYIDSLNKWFQNYKRGDLSSRSITETNINDHILQLKKISEDSTARGKMIGIIAKNYELILKDEIQLYQLQQENTLCEQNYQTTKQQYEELKKKANDMEKELRLYNVQLSK